MVRSFAISALAVALLPFQWSAKPLPQPVKTQLKQRGFWHKGCPVGLGDLRLLTVTHLGFDGASHHGQLVVNRRAASPLRARSGRCTATASRSATCASATSTGPRARRPESDVTASFECRQAVPSPCTGGSGTGTWSNHAYGLAVDINPRENPYVGCGQSSDPTAQAYRNRGRKRPGMVDARAPCARSRTPAGAGAARGSGNTKDYMHFSHNGH